VDLLGLLGSLQRLRQLGTDDRNTRHGRDEDQPRDHPTDPHAFPCRRVFTHRYSTSRSTNMPGSTLAPCSSTTPTTSNVERTPSPSRSPWATATKVGTPASSRLSKAKLNECA